MPQRGPRTEYNPDALHFCSGCERRLRMGEFRRDNRLPHRPPLSRCRRCQQRLKRARRHGGKPIPAEAELPPGAACGVCGAVEQLVLDHDHETGRLRGVLCRSCNLALGYLDDDPARLQAMIAYLAGALRR